MTKHHKRNVAGMQSAPKCQALNKAGLPCGKAALRGTRLCQSHSYEEAPIVPRAEQLAHQRDAYAKQQQELEREAREIEKLIRRAKINQVPDWLIDKLRERRSSVLDLADREAGRPRTERRRQALAEQGDAITQPAIVRAATSVITNVNKSQAKLEAERTRDRALGAMLGLFVGEAVGVTTTGFERSEREYSGMHGGGKLGLKRGEWAWNGAAALALSYSLLDYPLFEARDYLERLLDHRDHGSHAPTSNLIGPGNMTALALNRYQQFGKATANDPGRDAATNGCLARMAPVAVRYWKQPDTMRKIAEGQARTTHVGTTVGELSVSFADMIALAIAGDSRPALLTDRFWDKRFGRTLTFGELCQVPEDRIRSGNDAAGSLDAALWCVATGDGFEGAVHQALNLAGDAASIGAMAGQLAGAIYGASRIPAHWLELLAGRELIERAALELFGSGLAEAEGKR